MNKFIFPSFKNTFRRISGSQNDKALCWPKPDYGPMEVQRSQLLNGMRVAAAKPLGAQIAACTIMYQAGSRYEFDDYIGVNHFLRAGSSSSGCSYNSYFRTRVLQQMGSYFTCSTDRQTVAFTLRCPLPCFSDLKYYLLDTAARCCYNQWEIDDRKEMIKDDLVRIPPEQRVLDLVQRAAFAGPLSNSVFCEEERIDGMSENTINCYVRNNFRVESCSVGSVGLPFEEVLGMAESIDFKRERIEMRYEMLSCPRGGFDFYDLGPGSDTWIALAVPSCGTCDFPCLLKHAIIAASCGTGNIQDGQHDLDRMPQAPLGTMAGEDIFTDYKAFNISYMETGLFGIVAKTRACSARHVAFAAAEFLANVGDLDFNQIEIGKRRLKLSMATHDEDCVKVAEGLALQAANNVQIDSAKSSMALIDMITPDEVSCVAKALSAKYCNLAVAVVGDVGAVPHDKELLYVS